MEKLKIIKIGGNIIDDAGKLKHFLKQFSSIKGLKILIHGGGKTATELAAKLNVKQTIIHGRRITNAETLNIAIMVYAGLINKTIVAQLQAEQCNAMGFCGADANLIQSSKRNHPTIDFGFVGDILETGINTSLFKQVLEMNFVPVISAITHDGNGNLLNTNADTMASKIASALSHIYDSSLVYSFEKNGVLTDIENNQSTIPILTKEAYLKLKSNGTISKGMIPKLENAFEALERGVDHVSICHALSIALDNAQIEGTQIVK